MPQGRFDNVYQFKITPNDTEPPVWRRIEVPETYTFLDLRVAIQDAMGWLDYHLHEFRMTHPKTGKEGSIGIPDEEGEFPMEGEILAGWEQWIAEWFFMQNTRAHYLYDFGDGWEHTVILEKILPRSEGKGYPACTEGGRACPPEDCGGIPGYEDICRGPHEYQKHYKDYHPERFTPGKMRFSNPQERLKLVRA